MILMTDWLGQRAGDRPFELQQPHAECSVVDAYKPGPLAQRVASAVPLNHSVPAGVVRLLESCGPAHVARLVVAVAVDAIERSAVWSWANVAQKSLKGLLPFIADADPATAVARKVDGCSPIAALFHGGPRAIFRRAMTALRVAVSVAALHNHDAVQASARLRVSCAKGIQRHSPLTAAVAATDKTPLVIAAWRFGRNHQTTVALTDQPA